LSQSIFKTVSFRVAFGVWWWTWTELQLLIITRAGWTWKEALPDRVISNVLLGAVLLLVTVSLQHYLPQKNRYGYLLALCTALSGLWLVVSRFVLLLFVDDEHYNSFFVQTTILRGAVGFLMIGCMALIAVLWYTIKDQQESEKRKAEAERLSREAELNNLRQQLQPHFLFNSLNSINALIGLQPQQARTMIQQLSDFLRGTLKKEQKEWTTLDEELKHLQLYLDIEKVRFGHRLNAVVENNTSNLQLPVMLLQPVVENAIKFGLYDTTEAITISILASEEQGYLKLEIKNPFDPETSLPQKGTGFGLRSVQRRLSLLFGRQDLLQTQVVDTIFVTTIKIPQP
jgi:sensor histidine kinase YesM